MSKVKLSAVAIVNSSDLGDCHEAICEQVKILKGEIDTIKHIEKGDAFGLLNEIEEIVNDKLSATQKVSCLKRLILKTKEKGHASINFEGLVESLLSPVEEIDKQLGEINDLIQEADDDDIEEAIDYLKESVPLLERAHQAAIDYIDSTERNLACEVFDFETMKRAVEAAK